MGPRHAPQFASGRSLALIHGQQVNWRNTVHSVAVDQNPSRIIDDLPLGGSGKLEIRECPLRDGHLFGCIVHSPFESETVFLQAFPAGALLMISGILESCVQLVEEFGRITEAFGGLGPSMLLLILVIVVPTTLGLYVLGPISQAAGRLRAPTRFMLSDILWLLVHVQLILWYCLRFIGTQQHEFFVLTLTALLLGILAIWAGAISCASRAGVIRPSRRVTFILFHLPATLILIVAVSFSILLGYLLATNWVTEELRYQLQYMVQLIRMRDWHFMTIILSMPIVVWLMRRVAFWILSDTNVRSVSPIEVPPA